MNRCRFAIALMSLASILVLWHGDASAKENRKDPLFAFSGSIDPVVGFTGRAATAFMAFNLQGEKYSCYSAHPRSLGLKDTRGIRVKFGGLVYFCVDGLQSLAALTAGTRVETLKMFNLVRSPLARSEQARPGAGFFKPHADATEPPPGAYGQKFISPEEEDWPFRWIDELDLWGSLIMFWRIDTCGGGYLIDSCKPPPPPDCSQCWLDFATDMGWAFGIMQSMGMTLAQEYFNMAMQKLKSCLYWCLN